LLKGGIEVVEIPGDYVSYTEIMFKIRTPKLRKCLEKADARERP
jgi:hypothetical protein